uniref:uncharacterized protein LOC105353313 n=1 Tax=Fragaria vesca subsp. vesca TaxID=101020 RepID=UPI0005CB3C5A|nr:PREDICTED: uncharacterized protein LOC105353313 [Fragaria vesca subsp. vesca]
MNFHSSHIFREGNKVADALTNEGISLQWCVGDGRKISFWLDNWLGKPLASSIGVIGCIPLHAKVNEFIVDSHWALPALTAKEAFVYFSSHIVRRSWGKVIWSKAIQPCKSLVVWKALHGRLLTDDALQRRGFSLPSCCSFCGSHAETGVHLLLRCPRIMVLWKWVCLLFSHSFSPWSSLEDVFLGGWVSAFSKQKRRLWIFIACTLIWYIWITRNLLRFEGKVFDALEAQRHLLDLFKESVRESFHTYNNHAVVSVYSRLGISQLSANAPSFTPQYEATD